MQRNGHIRRTNRGRVYSVRCNDPARYSKEGIQHCEAGDILPSDNAMKDIDEQLVRDIGKKLPAA